MFKANILKPTEVEGKIIGLEPKAFNIEVPGQILHMVTDETRIKDAFRVDELTAQMTGLSDHQQRNLDEKISSEVLKKLDEVKEKAYAQAYKLGQEDGRKDAFDSYSAQIKESVEKMSGIFEQLENYKNEIFIQNEEYFIKLIFQLVKNVVLKNIQEDKESILSVLKAALIDTQNEEEVVIKLNKEDHDFLQTVANSKQKVWDSSRKVKLEIVDSVARGGCIVETNHGIIDAQIEERLNKLWKNIEARIPKLEQK